MTPTCKGRLVSSVTRPASPNDLKAEHYELACHILVETYKEQQKLLPPLTSEELLSLPEAEKLRLARIVVGVQRQCLEKAVALARGMVEMYGPK